MKISHNIDFNDFKNKKPSNKLLKIFDDLKKNENEIIHSFRKSYKNSYSPNLSQKLKKFKNINLFGMGGSSLGTQAIYSFFKNRIKKNFNFIDNLANFNLKKKKHLNLVVSKSGNTLETICNLNFQLRKNQKYVFITENKINYLVNRAQFGSINNP